MLRTCLLLIERATRDADYVTRATAIEEESLDRPGQIAVVAASI
jgi:hypothetical protein